jgi:MYXO-CTERM domain-containing protein
MAVSNRSLRSLPLLYMGLTVATLTACGPKIRFSDSVDNEFDLRWSARYDDRLHGPYVAGASFSIFVYDAREDSDLSGWKVVSRDPEILEILEQVVEQDDLDEDDKSKDESDVIVSQVYAAGEGIAILEVYDDNDDFVRATEVEVMQPDRIELHAAGPLFVAREDVTPSLVDDTPKLLSGGTATFQVQWYKGEQRLNGAGALGLYSEHAAVNDLWARTTLLDEDRDWATITMAPGLSAADSVITPIEFSANGVTVEVLDFSVVGPDAITSIELHGESESGASEHELLVVLAEAFDEAGESIWGVGFDWDLDGQDEPGEGDLFRYWFRKGAWNTLGAEYNGIRAEAEIQGIEGFVDSSNDISCFCSVDEDRPARGIAFGLLGLGMLGLVRRRQGG